MSFIKWAIFAQFSQRNRNSVCAWILVCVCICIIIIIVIVTIVMMKSTTQRRRKYRWFCVSQSSWYVPSTLTVKPVHFYQCLNIRWTNTSQNKCVTCTNIVEFQLVGQHPCLDNFGIGLRSSSIGFCKGVGTSMTTKPHPTSWQVHVCQLSCFFVRVPCMTFSKFICIKLLRFWSRTL